MKQTYFVTLDNKSEYMVSGTSLVNRNDSLDILPFDSAYNQIVHAVLIKTNTDGYVTGTEHWDGVEARIIASLEARRKNQ